MNLNIANIRKDYTLKSLSENDIQANPFDQFTVWWNEAIASEIDEVNAMTLATVKANNTPTLRIVLLKDYDVNGFTFFTNYASAKGNELAHNHHAAVNFFWKELQRQVRIEGIIKKVDETLSNEYFNSRPEGSKIGAWASPQSQVIASREILETNIAKYSQQFCNNIPRPKHWGGYVLQPTYFEFWQGRSNRLHDRLAYTLVQHNNWKIERLAP